MFYWFSGSILSSQDNLLLICGGYYPDSSQYSTYFTFYWLTHFVLSIQDNLLLTCGGTTPTVLNIWRTLLFIYYWFYIVYPWKLIIDLLWYYPGSSQYSRYLLFIYLLILYYLFKTICYLLVVVLLWQFSILGAFYFLLIYWIYFDYPIQLAIEL